MKHVTTFWKVGCLPYIQRYVSTSIKDTIFAVSSGRGKAAIAIFRISGSQAFNAVKTLTQHELPEYRKLTKKTFYDRQGLMMDQGMVCCFPAPHSYTGENVVEFYVHGGLAIIDHFLRTLSSMDGFRLAEAGEFTKRAFHNHKLDMTEIEAISELIDAETMIQKQLALVHVKVGDRIHYMFRFVCVIILRIVEILSLN
jgi:tRNA modification GTPase